ncbi:hypothetical protein FHU38_000483 [Saccharomonospora amisosensis]|uniref:ANTAR domain-containing protein n=1 Tax=Saccharomonospora amisosensis TaxID=1128677 RepID=A0A7X5UM04_9PSEU|nr:ANTAR domain-containing protein [Saccharomonospora amisosensis]NIJ10139.1 hypothetical protein [Saccharomonospora amisosensis]
MARRRCSPNEAVEILRKPARDSDVKLRALTTSLVKGVADNGGAQDSRAGAQDSRAGAQDSRAGAQDSRAGAQDSRAGAQDSRAGAQDSRAGAGDSRVSRPLG